MKKISIEKMVNNSIKRLIDTEFGTIEIYNPNEEQIKAILEFETNYFADNPGKTEIPDRDVLMGLIPYLTNLTFDNIEDETIVLDILSNPSPQLKMVALEIQSIINTINTIKVMETKNEMVKLENMLAEIEVVNNLPENVVKAMKGTLRVDDKTNSNLETLLKASADLSEYIESEDDKEIKELEKRLEELKNKNGK